MGLIANIRHSISARIAAYGMAGTMPTVPEAALEDLGQDGCFAHPTAQQRLCDVVRDEGEEAVRYLLTDYAHRTKLAILEYARYHGLDAARRRYRSPETAPSWGRVQLSIVRIILVAAAAAAILLGKWRIPVGQALAYTAMAAGAMSMIEAWYYCGTDIMVRVWSWFSQQSKPALWRDIDKLGEMYLHGHLSATELNQAIAMARSIDARCAWDRTTRVPIGTSTGLLRAEGVCAGAPTATPLSLSLTDICTSLMILGGTGSGKTQAINAMIAHIMASGDDSSLVVIDPKRSAMLDIYNAYMAMPEEIRQSYQLRVIGPESWECGYNPVDPAVMTPEAATAILSDAIKAEGGSGGGDDYWNSMVVEITTAAMHLHDLAGMPRDFAALYGTMTAPAEEITGIIEAAKARCSGNDTALETIARAKEIIRVNLIDIPDKTKGNIISSISSWLGRFTMPSMVNFRESTVSLGDLLNDKCLYVIDIPESLGKPGKLLRYYLFRQVYDVALSRLSDRTLNQDRHIILIADEVQESTNQWSFRKSALSREGKLCVIAATQSRSQLLSVWGNKEATDTVLANFRSRIILGTDDPETREWVKKLVSEGELPEHSYGTSITRNLGMNIGGGGGAAGGIANANPMAIIGALGSFNVGKSWGKNYTVSLKRSPLRDELFDSLGAGQAIAILNQGNCRRKTLLELNQIRLEKTADISRSLREHHAQLIGGAQHGNGTAGSGAQGNDAGAERPHGCAEQGDRRPDGAAATYEPAAGYAHRSPDNNPRARAEAGAGAAHTPADPRRNIGSSEGGTASPVTAGPADVANTDGGGFGDVGDDPTAGA